MKPQKYNEFKVDIVNGKVDLGSKRPTKRGQVSIHKHEADINNAAVKSTRLYYELVKAESSDPELDALKEEANELGVKFTSNIGKDALRKKIETFKEQ